MTDTPTPTILKYIDPMVDFGFKKIFKDSGNKQLLIRPLNAIFGLDIVDITIRDGEQLGLSKEERSSSFDLYCETADRRRFIVEVQIARQKHFLERALFYTSYPIQKSAPKDPVKRSKWDYDYPPVFFLGLLNFDLRHPDKEKAARDQFIHLFTLRDEQTGELMTDRLRFAFLEVARFDKPKEECGSFEDRFLFMMKNLPTFAEKPELWDDPYFTKMMEEAEYASMTSDQQFAYMRSLMSRWDNQNVIDTAREEGLEQGREEGLEQGLAQGLEKGRKEGRVEIARQMLEEGEPLGKIIKYTHLTEEEIRALRA